MFFTDVENADTKGNDAKTPAQDTSADKKDEDKTNVNGKTPAASLTPAEKTPVTPKKDTALIAAASNLQSAIDKGDAYVNSDKFNQMTAEKQRQLRDAIQTGKELMAKYNTMQAAMNSAALDVDQNNKNKTEANTNVNTAVLTTLNIDNSTSVKNNSTSDISMVTAPQLTQAAKNIQVLLGAPTVNEDISYDATTETATISGGSISGVRDYDDYGNDGWYRSPVITGDVKHIKITGPVTVENGNAFALFSGIDGSRLQALQDITGLNNLVTSNVTNMESMFYDLPNLKSLDLSHFDTHNVTSMKWMFRLDRALTTVDVSSSPTDNVTNIDSMFSEDPQLTTITGLNYFDTGNVTDMNNMFSYDTKLKNFDVSKFDTHSVINMNHMFAWADSLTSLDLSNFNTSNVTNMDSMFRGTDQLTSLNISNFDTNKVTNMDHMLYAADLSKISLGAQTKISGVYLPDSVPPTIWYKDADGTQGKAIADGKSHPGTWYRFDGTVTLQFVNAKHPDQIVYTSKSIAGSTSTPLDLTDSTNKKTYITDHMPDGYHYAGSDELYNQTQPNSVDFEIGGHTANIYVDGDEVKDDGTNKDAIHVLHYLEDKDGQTTQDPVPGMDKSDYWLGGNYGDTVTAKTSDSEQKAPDGYKLVNDTDQSKELTYDTKQNIIFYYQAEEQNTLSIQYVDAKTGDKVGDAVPAPQGYMNETFDPTDNNTFIKTNIPKGYHYAKTADELNHKIQPKNDGSYKYTTSKKTITVYVAGDEVKNDGTNADAVHVLHYLESQDNKPTTEAVPGMDDADYWLGGVYGDTVTASGKDAKQKAPAGYTLTNPDKQTYKLVKDATTQPEFIFYYQADKEDHLSVQFVNARTGEKVGTVKPAPAGYMNETFDPTDSNSFIKTSIPDGYHYAKTTADLNGKTQPQNDGSIKYTDKDDTVTVYVAGDKVTNIKLQYINSKTGNDIGSAVAAPEGQVGDTLTLGADSENVHIPAGYHYSGKNELTSGEVQKASVEYTNSDQTVDIYVTGDAVPNDGTNTDAIHVLHYLQGSTDKDIGGSYWIGGNYGDEVTISDSDAKQTIAGYTIVPKDSVTLELTQDIPHQVIFYYTAKEETNVTINFATKNGTVVSHTNPTGHTGEVLTLGESYFNAHKPAGYHYANGNEIPSGIQQPGSVTFKADRQTVTVYVAGDQVDTGDTVKVVHYMDGTTKPVPGLTDYVLGDGGHYGDTVTASGDDAAQKAPFGYKLVNPDAQTYVLTKGAPRTFIFYYTKNGGGSLPEPDRTPKLPIPGEVDIPQGTDLSGDTTYAGDAITNKDQLPDGTKYSWQPAPDTSKKGKQEGTVVVTYPDGTKTSINVTINIVDQNTNGNSNNGNNHSEAKEEFLKHNAYLYGQDGKRTNQAVLKAGSTVTTYGMVVINGRKFFTLDNDYYLAAGNAVAQTRKLKHNAYIYNKYGKRVGKKVIKTGQSMATYGTVVTIRSKKYYTIDHDHFMKANNFTKIANPDLANSELSPNAKQDNNKAFTVKALQHNAYLYNKEGKRANKVILNLNSKVKTYGTKTINGRKFYVVDNDYCIAAGNIDATKRKLTHNAYVYSQYGNRLGRKVVKQHQVVGIGTYGDPVGIRGKSYYIIGSGRYLKRANFETR